MLIHLIITKQNEAGKALLIQTDYNQNNTEQAKPDKTDPDPTGIN